MEIDLIQVQPSLRVEQAGKEKDRRRRQQQDADEFSETLQGEVNGEQQDSVTVSGAAPAAPALPVSLDIVSISLGAREADAAEAHRLAHSPQGAYAAAARQAKPAAAVPPKPEEQPAPPAKDKPVPSAENGEEHKPLDTLG